MRRVLGCLGLVFILASAVMLGASKLMPRLDAAQWTNAFETTGQIAGFSETGSRKRPLVCFVASNGEPCIFEADSYDPSMLKGQIVTVRYFLAPELRASLKPDFTTAVLWLGGTGCVLAAAGLALLLLQWRKSSLRRQLALYGTRLDAKVTGVHIARSVRVFGRRPLEVTCTLRSPQGIGEMTVKSGWVWRRPPFPKVGDSVPVLVDTNRPGQYCVLVEEAASATASSGAGR